MDILLASTTGHRCRQYHLKPRGRTVSTDNTVIVPESVDAIRSRGGGGGGVSGGGGGRGRGGVGAAGVGGAAQAQGAHGVPSVAEPITP